MCNSLPGLPCAVPATGLGKTTLIRSLMSTPGERLQVRRPQLHGMTDCCTLSGARCNFQVVLSMVLMAYTVQVHDGSFTPTDQFIKDPDSLCSTISWRDEDDRIIWVYRMQV